VPMLRAIGRKGSVTACHLPDGEILSIGQGVASQ
jgi:putative hemolysin